MPVNRKSVRGIVVQDDSVVLIRRTKPDRPVYWVFPGGGVEESDTSPIAALKREMREELGVDVDVLEQALELGPDTFYYCAITGGQLGTGNGPEFVSDPALKGSYNIELVSLAELGELNVWPQEVIPLLLHR